MYESSYFTGCRKLMILQGYIDIKSPSLLLLLLVTTQVRMDPRNKETDLDSLMYGRIGGLTEEQLKRQEGDYIYRYRYNGGGASQVWLSSGRYIFGKCSM